MAPALPHVNEYFVVRDDVVIVDRDHRIVAVMPEIREVQMKFNQKKFNVGGPKTKDGLAQFSRSSAGYVGYSDGWQDFNQNGRMTRTYAEATDGNDRSRIGAVLMDFQQVDAWREWGHTLRVPAPHR